MARINLNEPLSSADEKLLVALADPEAKAPAADWNSNRMSALVEAADNHGVLPVVTRKFRTLATGGTSFDPTSRRLIEESGQSLTIATGQSMMLSFHGRRIFGALAAGGVGASIVKGPVFAEKLYPHIADRPFGDIDILVDTNDIDGANEIIGKNGFELAPDPVENHSSTIQEFKWLLAGNSYVMIELHGNLIHSPELRRRLTFGRKELLAVGEGNPESPVALLMIAVIHGAGGHKFFRLQLLVDILQSARAVVRAGCEEQFIRAARRLGAELELSCALNAAGVLFEDSAALRLASLLPGSLSASLGRRLISPRAILDATTTRGLRSRLQRDFFRLLQKYTPSRAV